MINHIILVSLDTLRGDCLGSEKFRNFLNKPNFHLKTEILDNLINKGKFFSNCISAAPYTTASHASIFTGLFPLKHGVYEYFNNKICKETIFELAKKQGFITIMQTDFPIMLGKYLGLNNGVDSFFVENEDDALSTLFKNANKKTLSLFHFGGIHYPYGFHILKYGGKDYINKVKDLEKKYNLDSKVILEDSLDETFRNDEDKKLLFRYKKVIEYLYNNEMYDDLMKLYLEGINYFLDTRFRAFFEKLNPLLEREDCLLILFGDHGESWNLKSYGHFNSNDKGVLNVPLLFYGKNVPSQKVDTLVRTVDIGSAIINLIGFSIDKLDGIDLKPFSSDTLPDNLFAISQTWVDIDKNELLKHQQNAVKAGKLNNRLNPFKKAESIFFKNFHLVREYDEKGQLIFESKIENKSMFFKLRDYLDMYNKIIPIKTGGVNKTEEIKKLFNLMGYEI